MSRLPVLYLSHGAPPLADDPVWTGQLATWGGELERPSAILMVSAHWEAAPISLSSTTGAPLLYDFWGFDQRYYEVTYPAPPAPGLAASTERLLREAGLPVRRDESRGLDHGAYVPLVEMYPHADVPVVQLSLPTLDPATLVQVGRRLAPLRDEGALIVGSGFTTHNLAWFRPSADPYAGPVPAASANFDAWAAAAMASGDVGALVDAPRQAPAFRVAHPRSEHWAPLYVALGAALGPRPGRVAAAQSAPDPRPSPDREAGDSAEALDVRSVIDGFWYGLSKRSWQLD
ncbi:MAG: class III extradiol ring-cleavage dioxygenase [Dermatophilaceae bacterium]|jgi:4,5-DOPA dioxygenase extradiol